MNIQVDARCANAVVHQSNWGASECSRWRIDQLAFRNDDVAAERADVDDRGAVADRRVNGP